MCTEMFTGGVVALVKQLEEAVDEDGVGHSVKLVLYGKGVSAFGQERRQRE